MTTTFLRASEARSKGLTDEELEQLEVAGWYWPEVPKAGPRAEGEPLFRTKDIKELRNARKAVRS